MKTIRFPSNKNIFKLKKYFLKNILNKEEGINIIDFVINKYNIILQLNMVELKAKKKIKCV